jgi:hypothetical protein
MEDEHMKAILEMEAPESCNECRMVSESNGGDIYCLIANQSVGYRLSRHPNCPLKIVEDNKGLDSDICKNCQEEIDCLVKSGWDKCEMFN